MDWMPVISIPMLLHTSMPLTYIMILKALSSSRYLPGNAVIDIGGPSDHAERSFLRYVGELEDSVLSDRRWGVMSW
jgi:hypothetical protein